MPSISPDNFHFYLITGLIGLLFAKDEIMPFIKAGLYKVTGVVRDDSQKPATQASMDKLASYYNHDTTEILKSIDSNLQKVHVSINDVHKSVESLEDVIKELKHHHAEMREYGVKIRR